MNGGRGATDGRVRASDRDREQTLAELRSASVAGRLDLDDLRERANAAYSARTCGDLRALTADLPDRAQHADWPVQLQMTISKIANPRYRQPGPAFVPMIVLTAIWIASGVAAHRAVVSIFFLLLALLSLRAAEASMPRRLRSVRASRIDQR